MSTSPKPKSLQLKGLEVEISVELLRDSDFCCWPAGGRGVLEVDRVRQRGVVGEETVRAKPRPAPLCRSDRTSDGRAG